MPLKKEIPKKDPARSRTKRSRRSPQERLSDALDVTRVKVLEAIQRTRDLAEEANDYPSMVRCNEQLGKAIAMFTDVQKIENPFAIMTREVFLAELRDLIANDDLVREYLRTLLCDYDQDRGGAPADGAGTAGGEGSAFGPLSSAGAPARVPRGRIH